MGNPLMKENNFKFDHFDNLPKFDEVYKIKENVSYIKIQYKKLLFEGLKNLKNSGIENLEINDKYNKKLWILACQLYKYGRIYFISRSEVQESYLLAKSNFLIINKMLSVLESNFIGNRVHNYAFYNYIISSKNNLIFKDELIPKNAVCAISSNTYAVRKADFNKESKYNPIDSNEVLYDLHDLAHILAASLSSSLYGCKYFYYLDKLPDYYKNLIKSQKLKTLNAIQFSDGLVFSQLSRVIFLRFV